MHFRGSGRPVRRWIMEKKPCRVESATSCCVNPPCNLRRSRQDASRLVLWTPSAGTAYVTSCQNSLILEQCPILLLKGQYPIKLGSPNSVQKGRCPTCLHTCLEVSSMPTKTLIGWFRCLIRVGAKLCRTPAPQDRVWRPLLQ